MARNCAKFFCHHLKKCDITHCAKKCTVKNTKTSTMKFFKRKVITRLSDPDTPYLIRYNLFECKLFSIKIHRIFLSDDDCYHDHPWAFVTFILWGGYVEYYKQVHKLSDNGEVLYETEATVRKKWRPGTILYRHAKFTHRLEINKPATTLVITFKKVRQWGFYTPNGWKVWFMYSEKDRC